MHEKRLKAVFLCQLKTISSSHIFRHIFFELTDNSLFVKQTSTNKMEVKMVREEAKKLLLEGKKIGEIFDLIPGQACLIYKGEWPDNPEASDEIIYIPDIDLNDLKDDDMPTSEKINFMYTAQDFLNQTGGNIAAAKDLFDFVDWQNPNVQDLMDCTDDDEAKEIYGQTWKEMFGSQAKGGRNEQR